MVSRAQRFAGMETCRPCPEPGGQQITKKEQEEPSDHSQTQPAPRRCRTS